jgi:hypothetical protein
VPEIVPSVKAGLKGVPNVEISSCDSKGDTAAGESCEESRRRRRRRGGPRVRPGHHRHPEGGRHPRRRQREHHRRQLLPDGLRLRPVRRQRHRAGEERLQEARDPLPRRHRRPRRLRDARRSRQAPRKWRAPHRRQRTRPHAGRGEAHQRRRSASR